MEDEEQVNSAFKTPRHISQQSKRGEAKAMRLDTERKGQEGHPHLSLTKFQAALKIGSRKIILQLTWKSK